MPSSARKGLAAALLAALLGGAAAVHAEWKLALPGSQYEFPADHGSHPGFKTEWWYFTGNVRTQEGREFGYQLTFFRQGIRPGATPPEVRSRFVTADLKFAHFAVSDLSRGKFAHFQKLSRGAYGEAGFVDGQRLAWIDGWTCALTAEHGFRLRAEDGGVAIDLELVSDKLPVFHGKDGVSQKAEGPGRASHYYSLTRMSTRGTVRMDGETFPVTGLSWFDHEWATNQLSANQSGWDWLSLQFDDGTELMLFQLRNTDGKRDPHSAGTFIGRDGRTEPLGVGDFTLTPGRTWKSPATAAVYPVVWTIGIPKLGLTLEVRAALDDQELRLRPVSYWEGAVRAQGEASGRKVRGSGYLEMTGYAGPIAGMQASE